jgi:cytochrome c peroxidase
MSPSPSRRPHLRVALGQKLFHDAQLSRTSTISCATCHLSDHAFSDPKQFSLGVEDRTGTRNAMPLINLAWKQSGFFWDGRAASLRLQALMPIKDHLEMDQSLEDTVKKTFRRSILRRNIRAGL